MDRQPAQLTTADTSSSPAPVKRKVFIEHKPIGGADEYKLKKQKAQEKTMELLENWPTWEIWPLKVALPLVSLAAMPNGYFFNKAMIAALSVKGVTFTTSNIAMMGVPGLMAGGAHYLAVTRDILQQRTGCSTCVQMRAACIQAGIGVLYPLLFAVNQSVTIATDLKLRNLPKIFKDPMPTVRFAVETFSSAKQPLMYASIAQIVIAMGVTYFQQKFVHTKLLPVARGEVELKLTEEEIRTLESDRPDRPSNLY